MSFQPQVRHGNELTFIDSIKNFIAEAEKDDAHAKH